MKTIKIGTRASKLAMVQAEMVAAHIQANHPEIATELVPMTTTGDMILDKTLDKIGGKGLFVKELDAALVDGRADITVHSCKDLPMELPEALPLVAVSGRATPYDVLVLPKGVDKLDPTKPIGSSSARRRIQLQALYPEMTVKSIRGNVFTRLEKLDAGEYSALVLAAAGLTRLGLEERISRVFTPEEMLPSACQGTLAIQARLDEDVSFITDYNDADNMLCTLTERAFVRALDGGCSKPCAAHAVVLDDQVTITGMYVSDDEAIVLKETITAAREEAEAMATALALRLKAQGEEKS